MLVPQPISLGETMLRLPNPKAYLLAGGSPHTDVIQMHFGFWVTKYVEDRRLHYAGQSTPFCQSRHELSRLSQSSFPASSLWNDDGTHHLILHFGHLLARVKEPGSSSRLSQYIHQVILCCCSVIVRDRNKHPRSSAGDPGVHASWCLFIFF